MGLCSRFLWHSHSWLCSWFLWHSHSWLCSSSSLTSDAPRRRRRARIYLSAPALFIPFILLAPILSGSREGSFEGSGVEGLVRGIRNVEGNSKAKTKTTPTLAQTAERDGPQRGVFGDRRATTRELSTLKHNARTGT